MQMLGSTFAASAVACYCRRSYGGARLRVMACDHRSRPSRAVALSGDRGGAALIWLSPASRRLHLAPRRRRGSAFRRASRGMPRLRGTSRAAVRASRGGANSCRGSPLGDWALAAVWLGWAESSTPRPEPPRGHGLAQTTTAFSYDLRRRVSAIQTFRAALGAWSMPPPEYLPAPDASAGTLQLLLEDSEFTYDEVDNPVEIHDWRNESEWPRGSKPVHRSMVYDDLYRLTKVNYQVEGDDGWVSPFDAENRTRARRGRSPCRTGTSRRAWGRRRLGTTGSATRRSPRTIRRGSTTGRSGRSRTGRRTRGRTSSSRRRALRRSCRGRARSRRRTTTREPDVDCAAARRRVFARGGVVLAAVRVRVGRGGAAVRARRWDLADPGPRRCRARWRRRRRSFATRTTGAMRAC